MKRFVLTISAALLLAFVLFMCYYAGGLYLDLSPDDPVAVYAHTANERIYLGTSAQATEFSVRGVNLGSGIPGKWSTDYAINKDTYLRWFEQIADMGVNTIRVFSIQNTAFYKALDTYNKTAASPLYLIQGIWVNDYAQNSHLDGYSKEIRATLIEDCKAAVDVIHGKRFIMVNDANAASGFFTADVSDYVLGYVVGAEWTDVTVAYTDEKYPTLVPYEGVYLTAAEDASPFESMLCEVGDALIGYETDRYATQRLVSFFNSKTTDPFEYPADVTEYFRKCASIDIEHIHATEKFRAGLFASYSVYSYDLDYLSLIDPSVWPTLTEEPVDFGDCNGTNGVTDTYYAYLKLLKAHHTMPVVVLEFGATSGRGLAQLNAGTGRRDGNLSEAEQGKAIVECLEDIQRAGLAGASVYSWQDEWHKRTWNTMFASDLSRNVYWSDAQTADEHFGLLAFDPGKKSVCTVDGDVSEWSDKDVVARYDDGSSVSVKYDERYVYLRVYKPGYRFGKDTLYIPIDTTPKTGAASCPVYHLTFSRDVDFLIRIHARTNTALLVQDRYHDIHANFEEEITGENAYLDPPEKDSTRFEIERLAVKDVTTQFWSTPVSLDTYETGRLRYGNADPESPNYDSLADYIVNGENIELRIPWALLNFADPSRMQIHDDYYDGNYGVERIHVRKMYVGLGSVGEDVTLSPVSLKGWGNTVTYHERLKPAYYAVKAYWRGENT